MNHSEIDSLFSYIFENLHMEITKYLELEDRLNLLTINKYCITLDYQFGIEGQAINYQFKYRKCYPKIIVPSLLKNLGIKLIQNNSTRSKIICKYEDISKYEIYKYKNLILLSSLEKDINLEKYSIEDLEVSNTKFTSLSLNYKKIEILKLTQCDNITINLMHTEKPIVIILSYCSNLKFQNVSNNNKIKLVLDVKSTNIYFSDLLCSVKYPDYTIMQTHQMQANEYEFRSLDSEEYRNFQKKDKIKLITYYNISIEEFSNTNTPIFKCFFCDINVNLNDRTSNIIRNIKDNKNIELFTGRNDTNIIENSFKICSSIIKHLRAFTGRAFVKNLTITDTFCKNAYINKIYDTVQIVNSNFEYLDIDFINDIKSIEIFNCNINEISVNKITFSKITTNLFFLAKNINYLYIFIPHKDIDYVYLSRLSTLPGLFTFGSEEIKQDTTNQLARICDKLTINFGYQEKSISNKKLVIVTHSLDEIVFTDSGSEFAYVNFIGNILKVEIPKNKLSVIHVNGINIVQHTEYELRKSTKKYVQYIQKSK